MLYLVGVSVDSKDNFFLDSAALILSDIDPQLVFLNTNSCNAFEPLEKRKLNR